MTLESEPMLTPSPKQISELSTHDIGEAVLALARELWVTKDRLFVLENVLTEKGQLSENTIQNYQPSEEFKQALTDERTRFLNSILQSLHPE